MAYDRYDTRRENGRFSDDYRGRRDERGFFERAGDEVASWFGDEEAERRRREDQRMSRDYDRDYDRDRFAYRGQGREMGRDRDRLRSSRPMNWGSSERDYRSSRPRTDRDYDRFGYAGYEHDFSPRGYGVSGIDRGFSPSHVGASGYTGGARGYGYGSGESYDRREFDRGGYDRSETPWGRDDYRNTSFAGSARDNDRHYHSWRQRQLDDLDRDYDQYCRERQQRFESDFGTWRENRMSKRRHLEGIREHMDVVGSDGETIGKVDCVKGDHIVLTKSDSPDNRHHLLDCSMIETVEGDQIRLEMPAEEAKSRWEDADKRGFFGRDEDEDTNLERSFSGTYER